jgi:hypothetical protein
LDVSRTPWASGTARIVPREEELELIRDLVRCLKGEADLRCNCALPWSTHVQHKSINARSLREVDIVNPILLGVCAIVADLESSVSWKFVSYM